MEQYTFYAFDTDCIVSIRDQHKAETLKKMFTAIEGWHKTFDVFDKTSEASQFNASSSTFKASDLFYNAMKKMIDYREQTGARFEPYTEYLQEKIRNQQEITEHIQETYSAIHKRGQIIFLEDGIIQKSHPEIKVNFHSFLKGYACDYMRDYMYEAQGLRNFLIDFGGNILAEGFAADGQYWKVGIQNPNGIRNDIACTVDLINMSLVTSGSYERPIVLKGEMKSHIMSPETGEFLKYELFSISVQSRKSVEADVLSTALMVSDQSEFEKIRKQFGGIVYVVKEGKVTQYES